MHPAHNSPSGTGPRCQKDEIEQRAVPNEGLEIDESHLESGQWHAAEKLGIGQTMSWFGYRFALLVTVVLALFAFSKIQPAGPKARSALSKVQEEYVIRPRKLSREIKINGTLDYGDGQFLTVRAPLTGQVDKVAAHSVGDRVEEGEGLIAIQCDQLLEGERNLLRALEDFEAARRNSDGFAMITAQKFLAAERRDLLLLGISPERLTEIERLKVVSDRLPIKSEETGMILEARVHEGQHVQKGDVLYRIANPDPMWLFASVHVSDLHWISVGRGAAISLETPHAMNLRGILTVISPVVDSASRTVRIGIPLPNKDGKLQRFTSASATFQIGVMSDGMPMPTGLEGKYICVTHPDVVRESPGDCPISGSLLAHIANRREARNPAAESMVLAVPVEAVLNRDGHDSVRRVTSTGKIETVDITIGVPAQGEDDRGGQTTYFPVQAGLKEGDRVLVSSNVGLEGEMLIGK